MIIKTILAAITLCLTPAVGAFAQTSIGSYEVPANTSQTLDASLGQENLIIGELTMGDNSTLIVPSDFQSWNVYITEATIGIGASIVARGADGTANTATALRPAQAPRCGGGSSPIGRRGTDSPLGQPGADGTPLTIFMGVKTVGSLFIDASGGDGGASGFASQGGQAGRSDCTRNCTGGRGGQGGNGLQSIGGNGGDITFYFWNADEPETAPTLPVPGISFLSAAGQNGLVGNPGIGGEGAPRRRCRWPISNKKAQPNGSPGSVIFEEASSAGTISFQGIPAPTSAVALSNSREVD